MEHQKRSLQDVIQLTAEWTSFPAAKIGATTRLGEDLGLDGDDAGEFMVEFAKEFRVDLRHFEFSRHFGEEGINTVRIFLMIYHLIAGNGLKPVTIGDLAIPADKGEWQRPTRLRNLLTTDK